MQYDSWRIQVNPKRRGPRPLWIGVAVLAAGGVAAVAAVAIGTWTPARQAAVQPAPAAMAIASAKPGRPARTARAALPACSVDVPVAPQACETPNAGAALPAPAVQLIGTAVERGSCFGVFHTGDGSTRMASVGESVGGAEVTAITRQAATVRFQGRTYTLALSRSPASAAPGGRSPGGDSMPAAVAAASVAPAASGGESAASHGASPVSSAPATRPWRLAYLELAMAPAPAPQSGAAQGPPVGQRSRRQRMLPLVRELKAQMLRDRLVSNEPLAGDPTVGGQ